MAPAMFTSPSVYAVGSVLLHSASSSKHTEVVEQQLNPRMVKYNLYCIYEHILD